MPIDLETFLPYFLAPERHITPNEVENLSQLLHTCEGTDVKSMFMVTVEPQFVEVSCDPNLTLVGSLRLIKQKRSSGCIPDPSLMYGNSSRMFWLGEFSIALIIDRIVSILEFYAPIESIHIVGKSQAVFKVSPKDMELIFNSPMYPKPPKGVYMQVARDLVISDKQLSEMLDPITASLAGNHLTNLIFKLSRISMHLN